MKKIRSFLLIIMMILTMSMFVNTTHAESNNLWDSNNVHWVQQAEFVYADSGLLDGNYNLELIFLNDSLTESDFQDLIIGMHGNCDDYEMYPLGSDYSYLEFDELPHSILNMSGIGTKVTIEGITIYDGAFYISSNELDAGSFSNTSAFGTQSGLYAVSVEDDIPPVYTYSNLSIDTPYYDLVTESEIRSQLSATDPEEGDVTSRIQVYNDNYTSEDKVVGGNYYIMYMVDDTSGNSAYLQVDINIIDDLKPYFIIEDYPYNTGDSIDGHSPDHIFYNGDSISFTWYEGDDIPADLNYILHHMYPYDDYYKIWNWDSNTGWNESFANDSSGDLLFEPESLTEGVYQEVYTITDPSGNTASLTFNYEVLHNNAPTITGPTTLDVDLTDFSSSDILSNYSATDVEDGIVDVSLEYVIAGGEEDIYPNDWMSSPTIGSHSMYVVAYDHLGKESVLEVTVNVSDMSPALFKIDGIDTSSYNQSVYMSDTTSLQSLIDNITAIDGVDGDITSNMVVPDFPDFGIPGTTVLNITVTDSAGNEATLPITVTVIDDIAPIVNGATKVVKGITATLTISDITAELNATDNVDGIISVDLVSDGYSGNSSILGSYVVQYKATDSAGNVTYHDVRVWVVDNQAPAWVFNDYFVNLGVNQSMSRTELVSLLQSAGMIGSDISYTVTFVTDEYSGNEEIAGAYQVTMNVVYDDGSEESITVQLNVPENNNDDVIVVDPEPDRTPLGEFIHNSIEWSKTAWSNIKNVGESLLNGIEWTYDHILKPVWEFVFVKNNGDTIPEYTTTEISTTDTTITTESTSYTTSSPLQNL